MDGKGAATETAIGHVPAPGAIDLEGLDTTAAEMDTLMSIDLDAWNAEAKDHKAFFDKFGDRIPENLVREQQGLVERLERNVTQEV